MVDQSTRSLNVVVNGVNSATQVCGVRVKFTPPPPHTSSAPAAETVAPTWPPVASENSDAETALRPTDIAEDFTADLQLPQGVAAEGMRLYYLNSQQPDGWVDTWNYNGTTAGFLGSTFSNTYAGYGSRYQTFSAPYMVNRAEAGLGLVAWLPPSKYYRFCGVRVRYIEDGRPQFRFLAGTAFHPRNFSSTYRHLGAGCIGVTRQFVYLPMLRK